MGSLLAFSLVNGLSMAMAVFLVASGLTLIYGVLKIVNFAHGSFFMVGAYTAFTLVGADPSMPALLAGSLVSGLVAAILGLVTDVVVFRRLRLTDPVYSLVATFSILLMCNGAVKLIWGLDFHSVNPPEAIGGAIVIGPIVVPQLALFSIGVGVAAYLALELVINRLWIGKVMNAVAYDRRMSANLGLRVPLIFSASIMVAFFLAGWAGGMLLPSQALSPALFDAYLVNAFIVVIIGGLGNIRGAFVASVLLGLVDSLNVVLLPQAQGFAVQLAMVACLIWRPQGILTAASSREIDDGHSVSHGTGKLTAPYWFKMALGCTVVLAVILVPAYLDQGLVILAGIVLIEVLFALSWNLLFGYCGMVSFGHAAFFMLGAYLVGYGLKNWPVPFLALLAVAAVVGAASAWAIGKIALRRMRGVTFAVLTLVVSQIAALWVAANSTLGSEDGIPAIPRPVIELGVVSIDLQSAAAYYWFLCVAVAIVGGALWLVCSNSFGRSLVAIRQDAQRAAFFGIDVHRSRVTAFCMSGAVAALAGGLQAPWTQIVTPLVGSYLHSAQPMFNALLGGSNFFWGPALGAVLFTALEHAARPFQGLSEILTGAALLVVILNAPTGVMGALARLVDRGFAAEGGRRDAAAGSEVLP